MNIGRLALIALATGVALAIASFTAVAERAMADKDREAEATDIFVGTVTDVYTKDVTTKRLGEGTVERRYLFEFKVESVERGSVQKDALCYVRAWHLIAAGKDGGMGESGHSPLPKLGERVHVFCVRGSYEFMPQSDNGFAAVYPTGFDPLPTKGK